MTELNPELNPEPNQPHEAAEADAPSVAEVAWPEPEPQQVQDPAVSAVLNRLAAVQQAPVSGHGEVYAGMHDALLEALNEDVAAPSGLARRIHAAGDGGS
ncbi:hypothetical protein ACFVTM_07750 [Arthrobacter sp. NPDC058130]|uniref:hypothetical protein n=1 Tax=Arthrobacter sp. NPDC058130 TaxID=3346353 RepID=UPI0036EF9878